MLTIFKTVYALSALLSLVLTVVIVHRNWNNLFNKIFALVNIGLFVWSIGRFIPLVTTDYNSALLATRTLYFASFFLYVFFLHSILIFLGLAKRHRYILTIFYINAVLLTFFNTWDILKNSGFIISHLKTLGFFPYYESPGPLYALQLFANITIPLYAVVTLLLNYKYTSNNEKKDQLKLILISSVLGFLGGGTILFMVYDIPIAPWGVPLVVIQFISITYAIKKYQFLNIKILGTELLVFGLALLLLSNAVLSKGFYNSLVDWLLFIFFSLVGLLLIRSVNQEVSQREHIEKLAEDLGKANERLKELDKQKTEFVSIASHQLRSPLTAIKGYSSMLLEGSFGPVPKKAKEAIDVIFQSSQKMISVIEDFLNITRIELGRMKYEMSDIDVGALAKQVTEEQRPQVVKNGLKLEFEDDGHDHNVYADMGKLNQVFNNIIDNAGKYTKEGWIRVRVENLTKPEGEGVVRFVVKDSGVGIPAETLPKLFEKFVRAYDAGKVNLIGTGLGLYAAKQIVEGLGGKIWAESEGKGKGSTFIVELKHTKPLAEQEKEKKVVDFVEGI